MTKDEALKLALEALDGLSEPYDVLKAQEAIKEALAQPEQELSTWAGVDFDINTTPPQRTWVGLIDEEWEMTHWSPDFRAGAKWAEAKLKEKNT